MVKNKKSKIQYIYSSSTYKRKIIRVDGTKSWFPRGKCGETEQENASIRISQQDGTSTLEKLELLGEKVVSKSITDKKVRDKLIENGYAEARVDADREWIEFINLNDEKDMLYAWLEAINELEHGKIGVTDFEPDDYQWEYAHWTKNRWDSGATEIANGSKMRSGKCLMTHLSNEVNDFKKILVITGKPGALDGWGELLIKGKKAHVRFSDNHFFHYKTQKNKCINFTDQRNTVGVGLQWVHTNLKKGGNKLLEQILNTEWDVLIHDECHTYKDTLLVKKFIAKLKIKNNRVVDLSGTSFKLFMSNEIAEEDRWAWDYIKEQNLRNWLRENEYNSDREKRFRYLPKMHWALMNVSDKIRNLLNEDKFNLGANGLWGIDKSSKKFIYPEAVNELINFVRLQGYKNVPELFKPFVDLHTRHSFWLLPDNSQAIVNLAKLLERHPYFKKFKIICATGNSIKEKDVIKEIKRIEDGQSEFKGTIVISCGKLVEGTTVPEWCSIHQLNSDKSATSYFQSNFRLGSSCEKYDKQDVCVYDYDPERFIQTLYELAIDSCDRDNNQSPSEWIETEWNNVCDVYDFDGAWKTLSGKDIIKKATAELQGNTDIFSDITLVKQNKITDEHINIMNGSEYTTKIGASSSVNSNEIETGTVSSSTRDGDPKTTQRSKDEVLVTRLQILEAIKKIPNLIYISYDYSFEIKCVEDIIKCCEVEILYQQTGLTSNQWSYIINVIDKDKVNRRIDAYINE
jgi:hypothetical protein